MTPSPAFKNGLAKSLAGLTMAALMISSDALAKDTGLSLPQTTDAPLTLRQPNGLIGDPDQILQVYVGSVDQCCDGRTPVAGRYSSEQDVLSFAPAFGFSAGEEYVVRITQQQESRLIPFSVTSDVAAVPAAVTETYPSGDLLPENTLRFYIHFSTPMKPGVAFDYIKLRQEDGTVDDAAFMRFKRELWNGDRTRLTVLIDPGRIKRNVATNLELGPALHAGQHYTLSVDAGWPAADGKSRLPGFTKQFRVTDPLRALPDVDLWEITQPCMGRSDPLRITFDRPFDRHLLGQALQVLSADGEAMDGTVEITDGERQWAFFPDEDWRVDGVKILVNPELEDIAANNFRDLLDHIGSDATDDISTIAVPVSLQACSE